MKQTAVEWLMPKILELTLQLSLRKISARNCELEIANLFEQAKAMEKEQHDKTAQFVMSTYKLKKLYKF
jgi:hypothetical protein